MQSGKIKKWNKAKGYGFIDVDDQVEDVFFHVSKVELSQPITIGQPVYFNSERNDKGQLRATEVTPMSLSISESSTSKISNSSSRQAQNNNSRPASKQKINNWSAIVFGILGLLAIAYFGFIALQPKLFPEGVASTTTSAITGDAQIDNTIALIQQGGPYPYPNKDGTTFGNREGKLPAQSQGYYHEYTVPTPGVSHRGARRIVTGGNPPTVYYLTIDHYDSFSKLEVK